MTSVSDRITKAVGVCGGNACIRGTRITVWGLVARRRLGLADRAILERVQGLTQDDLNAAWQICRPASGRDRGSHPPERGGVEPMALLYADEDLDYPVVECLPRLGHDVLTVQEAGRTGNSDAQILADATAAGRDGSCSPTTAGISNAWHRQKI